jgi:MerR family transcriptional regulator/heat shock protein HspR
MTAHLDRSRSDHQRRDPGRTHPPHDEQPAARDPGDRDRRLRERGVYVISVAAELAQVHPQTLRSYERAGLIEPARTPGGDRRYSDTDLDRVSRITELSGEGINLNGIGRILELEGQVRHLEAELDRARRRIADLAPHNNRGSSQLVPTRQGLVPWRHPLDFTFPTGGA